MWIILCEMWIIMASLKYIVPDYKNPAEEIKWLSDERIQSVAHSSIKHEDKFKEQLNSVWNIVSEIVSEKTVVIFPTLSSIKLIDMLESVRR